MILSYRAVIPCAVFSIRVRCNLHKRQTCDLCIPRICRTVIQNFKMYVRVQDIEIPDRLKQITVKSRFSCTDIDGSVFQADQVTEIVFSLKKLSTSGSYIFIKNLSVLKEKLFFQLPFSFTGSKCCFHGIQEQLFFLFLCKV